METNHCPTCQAPIPANAPGGFCPACLLRDADETPAFGPAAPSLEEISAAFPRLEVMELIGQGGMGFVYKVRQPGLDRVVALKILAPELGRDPAFAERFAREARTLGKLHHPNIVTVFEHGESGGFFYLIMEYVDGVNLRQAMRAGRFTPDQALAIVPGICDALQAAHAQGVWHRDIKPENILLDREGKVKIADFGIARIVGDPRRDFTLTLTGNALGSAAYMAPEQHEKPHDVDHRADIYSLGVVIYEMLTGELPLGRFPLPSQRAEVGKRIDEIVLRTLEKERELRQQSADEVKTEIEGAGEAAEPAGNKTAPEISFSLSRLPRLVLWSLCLLVLGEALWIAGSVLGFHVAQAVDAREWSLYILSLELPPGVMAVAVAVVAMQSVGGLAGLLGLLGSLRALYEMKRGWMPPIGRWLLIGFALVPSAVLVIALAFAGHEALHMTAQKGFVLLREAGFYAGLSLIFAAFISLARPFSPVTEPRRQINATCFVLAASLAVASVLVAKRNDGRWPYAYHKSEAVLNFPKLDRPSDAELLSALRTAAGRYAGDFHLSARSGQVRIAAMTSGSSTEGPDPTKDCLVRFLDLLPANVIESHTMPMDITITPKILKRESGMMFTVAAAAAVLAALAGGRRAAWVVAGAVVLHLGLIAAPRWPAGRNEPVRLIAGGALPPLTADELPTPDFSSPEKAAMSVYDAFCFGRLDVAKQGVSKALAKKIRVQEHGWEGLMSRCANQRFAVISWKQENGSARVQGYSITRGGIRIGVSWPRVMVLEDGGWKLDSLDADAGATAHEKALEEAFRKMNTLANASDDAAFMRCLGENLLEGSSPPRTAGYFKDFVSGEILMTRWLPRRLGQQADFNRLIAQIRGNDSRAVYRIFTFADEDGQWKLRRWEEPDYRAWARFKFHPENDSAASILRGRFGFGDQFAEIPGAEGEFFVWSEDPDADKALRGAKQLIGRLGTYANQSSFQILQEPVKPTTPWTGEGHPLDRLEMPGEKAASKESPPNAMKELLLAARNHNGRIFQNRLSDSFKEMLRKRKEDPGKNFGDFGSVEFVEAKRVDDRTAEVVVEATDGSKRRVTFRMILEDGMWKLTEDGL